MTKLIAPEQNCPACSAPFNPRRRQQKYCSSLCRSRAFNRARREELEALRALAKRGA